MARYWFPVAYSEDVTASKPISARLLKEPLVVYRDAAGSVVAARDLCPHRGAALSLGTVERGILRCGLHGSCYGEAGKATAESHDCGFRADLLTVACQERYGMVWARLAKEEAAGLPDWPEREDSGWRHSHMPMMTWYASAPRQVENFNDVAHLSWVHVGTFGNREAPEIPNYTVEDTAHGLRFSCPYASLVRDDQGNYVEDRPVTFTYDLTLPFFTRLKVERSDGSVMYIFDAASPVDVHETRVFFLMTTNVDPDEPDDDLIKFEARVLAEDQPMVEAQRPEELPLDLAEEFHIRADQQSIHFRRKLAGLGLGDPFSA